jgi:hypothetical protein
MGELESLIEYLFSGTGKPAIPIDYIISFLIIALFLFGFF